MQRCIRLGVQDSCGSGIVQVASAALWHSMSTDDVSDVCSDSYGGGPSGPARNPGTPIRVLLSIVRRSAEPASSSSGPTPRPSTAPASDFAEPPEQEVVVLSRNRKRVRGAAKPSAAPHLDTRSTDLHGSHDTTGSGHGGGNEEAEEAEAGEDEFGFTWDEPVEPASFASRTVALTMTAEGEHRPRRGSRACAKLLVRSGLRCPFCFEHRSVCHCNC